MKTISTPRTEVLTGLVESYNQLRRLEDQLGSLRVRLEVARRYLGMPGNNQQLGQAQFDRIRARYSATLTGLRVARREAHRRLGLTAPQDQQNVA